jgi:pimeloyl-ACP methyl ester carboxylesterase
MFEFQSHLIFPTQAVPPPGPWPRGAERLSLETPDGKELVGIHIPAESPSEHPTLILGFGGNAWNAQDVAQYLHELFPEEEIVAFYYRGYAPSQGSPSAEALLADAPLVYDFAVERLRPKRVIAIGFSIGSAVAATLAASRKLDGLILVTAFDSLKALAQSMFPWLPIGPFFDQEMDVGSAVEKVEAPVAIITASEDEIVPTERTEALRSRVPSLLFDRTIAGAGHNDIYARSDFQAAMRDAFATVQRNAA